MKLIRAILGKLILILNAVFSPKSVQRTAEQQADVNQQVEALTLYQFGGGKRKVPCLRIEEDGKTEWMYESNDIIAYLEQRFN